MFKFRVREKIANLLAPVFIFLIRAALAFRMRDYRKTRELILWAFIVQVWTDVKGKQPLDVEDPLIEEITHAFGYYCYSGNKSRKSVSMFEKLILPIDYAYWFLRHDPITTSDRARAIVRKYKLSSSIRYHRNVLRKSNVLAAEEITDFERAIDESALEYWSSLVNNKSLPCDVLSSRKTKNIGKWAKDFASSKLREIGRHHRLKYDFSLGALTALLALVAVVMAVFSYLRVWILFGYLEIPFADYFSISDYLSNGIGTLDITIVLLGVAFTYWAYNLSFRSIHENSIVNQKMHKSFPERVVDYFWDFFVVGTFLLFVWGSYIGIKLPVFPLGWMFIWVSARLLSYPKTLEVFKEPQKLAFGALVLIMFIGMWINSTVAELVDIVHHTEPVPSRSFKFDGETLNEKQWRLLATTSSFMIFLSVDSNDARVLPIRRLVEITD